MAEMNLITEHREELAKHETENPRISKNAPNSDDSNFKRMGTSCWKRQENIYSRRVRENTLYYQNRKIARRRMTMLKVGTNSSN